MVEDGDLPFIEHSQTTRDVKHYRFTASTEEITGELFLKISS